MICTWVRKSQYDRYRVNFIGGLMDKLREYEATTLADVMSKMEKDNTVFISSRNRTSFEIKDYEKAADIISISLNNLLGQAERDQIIKDMGLHEVINVKCIKDGEYLVIYIKIEEIKRFLRSTKYLFDFGLYDVGI